MQDPQPDNIYGEKSSELKHIVRWDYVVLGLLGLYVAWNLFGGLSSPSENSDEMEEIAGNLDAQDAAEVVLQ